VSTPDLGATQPPVQWVSDFLSPRLKRGLGVTLTTRTHLVPWSRMSRSYTSSPPRRLHGGSGTALLFYSSYRASYKIHEVLRCMILLMSCTKVTKWTHYREIVSISPSTGLHIECLVSPAAMGELLFDTIQTNVKSEKLSQITWFRSQMLEFFLPRPRRDDATLLTSSIIKSYGEVVILYQKYGIHISHPDIRVKHCAYGHSVTTLLNARSVTTVSRKYILTVASHATILVAVPSTVCSPANCKINVYYLTRNLKS
jgi:hypothetical protein